MDEKALGESLRRIHEMIDSCRPRRGAGDVKENALTVSPRGKATAEQQLDDLQDKVHHLVFDLEATKRENRYFRNIMRARRRARRLRREEENGKS